MTAHEGRPVVDDGAVRTVIATPPGTRLVLVAEGIDEAFGTRTDYGWRITWAWGEPTRDGWYEPVLTQTDDGKVVVDRDRLEAAETALELAEERLTLARGALVDTGYFTEAEVGPDVAPRIIELWSSRSGASRGEAPPARESLPCQYVFAMTGAECRDFDASPIHVSGWLGASYDRPTHEYTATDRRISDRRAGGAPPSPQTPSLDAELLARAMEAKLDVTTLRRVLPFLPILAAEYARLGTTR